jgi:hypothetical protein
MAAAGEPAVMLSSIFAALTLAQSLAMPYLGRPSVFIDNGVDLVKDSSFADGTIEFDVALHGHAAFAGIAFRAQSSTEYELVYLRPHLSRTPDAIQYTPVFHNSPAWQLYTGPGFTAAAELPLNRWVHVKIAVLGYQARVFVDGAAEPQLTVTSLRRPWGRGMVGYWASLGGANFSNLRVTPVDAPAPPAPADPPSERRTLMTWELSPAFDTVKQRDDVLPAGRDRATFGWTPVTAEAGGLVNISRYRASVRAADAPAGDRDLVYARTVITAIRAQRMKLDFAYSDAVHVFVNGRLLFGGDSGFNSRYPNFLGIAGLGHDALFVDLVPGRNEIVLALSETFGGWGFAARLEPVEPEYEPER